MNNKAITKVVAGIIIAVVLIGAFLVPIALVLVSTNPSGGRGAWFVENDEPFVENGILALKFTITDATEILTTNTKIMLRGRGVLSGEIPDFNPCSVSSWIGMDTPIVGGMILFSFSTEDMSGPSNSIQTYTGSAISPGTLLPGTYIYAISVDCIAPSWANVFFWVSGTVNSGTAGDVELGFCDDYNNDGLWQCAGTFLLHVVMEGDVELPLDGEPPTNVTNGDAGLIDTVAPPPPLDATQTTTMIIIGLIVLILGIFFIGIGTRGGSVIFSIIGFILLIVGLAIIAFGAIPFFAPALVIREEKVSNMLKGSLNLKGGM